MGLGTKINSNLGICKKKKTGLSVTGFSSHHLNPVVSCFVFQSYISAATSAVKLSVPHKRHWKLAQVSIRPFTDSRRGITDSWIKAERFSFIEACCFVRSWLIEMLLSDGALLKTSQLYTGSRCGLGVYS